MRKFGHLLPRPGEGKIQTSSQCDGIKDIISARPSLKGSPWTLTSTAVSGTSSCLHLPFVIYASSLHSSVMCPSLRAHCPHEHQAGEEDEVACPDQLWHHAEGGGCQVLEVIKALGVGGPRKPARAGAGWSLPRGKL